MSWQRDTVWEPVGAKMAVGRRGLQLARGATRTVPPQYSRMGSGDRMWGIWRKEKGGDDIEDVRGWAVCVRTGVWTVWAGLGGLTTSEAGSGWEVNSRQAVSARPLWRCSRADAVRGGSQRRLRREAPVCQQASRPAGQQPNRNLQQHHQACWARAGRVLALSLCRCPAALT